MSPSGGHINHYFCNDYIKRKPFSLTAHAHWRIFAGVMIITHLFLLSINMPSPIPTCKLPFSFSPIPNFFRPSKMYNFKFHCKKLLFHIKSHLNFPSEKFIHFVKYQKFLTREYMYNHMLS